MIIIEHFLYIVNSCNVQILIHGIVDSESPSIVSQLTELTQKQLQVSPPTPAQSTSSLPGAKGVAGGGDETTIGEILGLAVAMLSLAGEQCVQSDAEMADWRVSLMLCWVNVLPFLMPAGGDVRVGVKVEKM